MQRRPAVVLTAYAAVVVLHLSLIAAGQPSARATKWLLMPALLGCVLLAARPGRPWAGPRRRGLTLLAAAVGASWAGDVLLGRSFVVGLAAFALAHVAYLALFLGPARSRRPSPWAGLGYAAWVAGLLPVLWPDLGDLAVVVALYGVVLAATATAATGVNAVAGWGGLLFLASDSLLAFRVFDPGFAQVFPDPWQDLTIMALYCAAEGLMAYGVLRRLHLQPRAAESPAAALPAPSAGGGLRPVRSRSSRRSG